MAFYFYFHFFAHSLCVCSQTTFRFIHIDNWLNWVNVEASATAHFEFSSINHQFVCDYAYPHTNSLWEYWLCACLCHMPMENHFMPKPPYPRHTHHQISINFYSNRSPTPSHLLLLSFFVWVCVLTALAVHMWNNKLWSMVWHGIRHFGRIRVNSNNKNRFSPILYLSLFLFRSLHSFITLDRPLCAAAAASSNRKNKLNLYLFSNVIVVPSSARHVNIKTTTFFARNIRPYGWWWFMMMLFCWWWCSHEVARKVCARHAIKVTGRPQNLCSNSTRQECMRTLEIGIRNGKWTKTNKKITNAKPKRMNRMNVIGSMVTPVDLMINTWHMKFMWIVNTLFRDPFLSPIPFILFHSTRNHSQPTKWEWNTC